MTRPAAAGPSAAMLRWLMVVILMAVLFRRGSRPYGIRLPRSFPSTRERGAAVEAAPRWLGVPGYLACSLNVALAALPWYVLPSAPAGVKDAETVYVPFFCVSLSVVAATPLASVVAEAD